jgi:hypothetical protein
MALGRAVRLDAFDPRTRKTLDQSPRIPSAQLRTYIAVQAYPPWTPGVVEFGGQVGGQPWGR